MIREKQKTAFFAKEKVRSLILRSHAMFIFNTVRLNKRRNDHSNRFGPALRAQNQFMGRQNARNRHLVVARSKRGIIRFPVEAMEQAVASIGRQEIDSGSDSDCEIVITGESVDECHVVQAYTLVLRWKNNARPKRVAVNLGLSERIKYRRLQETRERHKAFKGCLPITKWFQPTLISNSSDALADVRITNP